MKPAIVILACILLFSGCFSPTPKAAEITFPDGFIITAAVASTPEQQALGLSGRPSLAENGGMLFAYSQPSRPGFWMPDMSFPIDMLFLDANFTIVDANINAQPCPSRSNCPTFTPKADCAYVLEICANCSIRHNATIGSRLKVVLPHA